MSDETTTAGAPDTGAVDAGTAPEAPQSPVARAIEVLRQREAAAAGGQPADAAPAETAAPADGGDAAGAPQDAAPSVADMVLGGAEQPSASGEPIDATEDADPKSIAALTKIMELERAARERERALDERARRLERFERAAQLAERGDDFGALKALGLSYEELTAKAIRGEGSLEPVTEELERLKQQLEELPKTYEEKLAEMERQREQAAMDAWRTRTASTLRSDTERWGLLHDPVATQGRDAVDLVYETIERHYTQTGEMLDEARAADMLEASLEKRARELALSRQSGPSKLQRILGLAQPTPPAQPEASSPAAASQPGAPAPTVTSEAASSVSGRDRDGSSEASRRRAEEVARRLLQGG